MPIPEFLKRENRKPLSSENIEMMRLCEKYKEQFGDYPDFDNDEPFYIILKE